MVQPQSALEGLAALTAGEAEVRSQDSQLVSLETVREAGAEAVAALMAAGTLAVAVAADLPPLERMAASKISMQFSEKAVCAMPHQPWCHSSAVQAGAVVAVVRANLDMVVVAAV